VYSCMWGEPVAKLRRASPAVWDHTVLPAIGHKWV